MKFFAGLIPGAVFFLIVLPSPGAALTVTAPAAGAVVGEAGVILSGRAGGPSVQVSVNGRPLPAVPVRGGFFSLPVTLSPGANRLDLRSGPQGIDISLEYRAGGGGYRFHPGYAEGDCGDCHEQSIGRIEAPSHSALCHSCHDRKDDAAFLHGPVGAGQCSFCHDPHGSAEKAFLTRSGAGLCEACHDQPGSWKHMESSRGKECVECHNPHGSEKKFFIY